MFRVSVLTLYPDMFPGPLGFGLSGSSLGEHWTLDATNIRDFATDKHGSVDDTPSGGGPGMVLRADVLGRAIDSVSPPDDSRPRFLLSPRGEPLRQPLVRDLLTCSGVVLVCGRFEGVDERVIEGRSLREISVGDYVLSCGELGAFALLDSVIRLLPGVMGNPASGVSESFEDNLLEHPHYTRPLDWEGRKIPDVLVSGDHKKIEAWRRSRSIDLTRSRRPDILVDDTD